VTFDAFSENSEFCEASDFTYSIAVTPPSGVTDTKWITLSGRTVTWQTDLAANVGVYTIEIIAALPTTSSSVAFTLNVVPTCATGQD
jgi:hypothetical protein